MMGETEYWFWYVLQQQKRPFLYRTFKNLNFVQNSVLLFDLSRMRSKERIGGEKNAYEKILLSVYIRKQKTCCVSLEAA